MAPCVFGFIIIAAVFIKISTAQIPASFFRQQIPHNTQSVLTNLQNVLPNNLVPISKLKSIPDTLGINLPSISPQSSSPSSLSSILPTPSSNIGPTNLDSTVLNNLAIALQLLIVSNILNAPNSDPGSELPDELSTVLMTPSHNVPSHGKVLESLPVRIPTQGHPAPISSLPVSSPYQKSVSPTAYVSQGLSPNAYLSQSYSSIPESYIQSFQHSNPNVMPMANFVGSSGFVDSGSIMNSGHRSGHMHPRSSLSLMSPYEAIGPNSPFTDPILSSPYGSAIISKKDFQSPYSYISGDTADAFSMNDLF